MSYPPEPMFPILGDDIIRAIPWALIAPHEAQAQRNHSQSLRRLSSRGGLSPCEAIAIIKDRPWSKVHPAWARAALMCELWNAEKAKAQAANNADAAADADKK